MVNLLPRKFGMSLSRIQSGPRLACFSCDLESSGVRHSRSDDSRAIAAEGRLPGEVGTALGRSPPLWLFHKEDCRRVELSLLPVQKTQGMSLIDEGEAMGTDSHLQVAQPTRIVRGKRGYDQAQLVLTQDGALKLQVRCLTGQVNESMPAHSLEAVT